MIQRFKGWLFPALFVGSVAGITIACGALSKPTVEEGKICEQIKISETESVEVCATPKVISRLQALAEQK